MKRRQATWLVAITAFCLNGCSGPIVRSEPNNQSVEVDGLGSVSYYLPDRLFTLSFTRARSASNQLAALNDAKAATALSAEEVARLKRELRNAQAMLNAGIRVAEARQDILRLGFLLSKAEDDLAEALAQLGVARDDYNKTRTLDNNCGFTDTFTLTPYGYVADTAQRYRAKLVHPIGRKDALTLSTTASGLLSSGNSIASDQSAAIAQAIGGLIGAPAGLQNFATENIRLFSQVTATEATPEVPGPPPNPCTLRAPFEFSYLLDPSNASHLEHFITALRRRHAHYKIEVTSAAGQAIVAAAAPVGGDGLFYRRNLPHVMSAYVREPDVEAAADEAAAVAILFEMPNASPTEFVGYPTGALTETKYTIAFESGMLTSYNTERPSELLAAVNLPLDVVKAILTVPGELLTLRYKNLTEQNNLTGAQIDALKQAYFLEQARLGAFPSTAPITPPDDDSDDDGDGTPMP